MKSHNSQTHEDFGMRRFERQFLVTFLILFLIFNWEILLALTGVNESLSARVDFIRNLHLSWGHYVIPGAMAFGYLFLRTKISNYFEAHSKKKIVPQVSELEKATQLLFGSYSDIGLAGKNVIDETLIYSTAQENFLKKNSLSLEEVIWAREELCLKYQDSIKKIQELMIVLAMQNQEKVLDMQQRLKDEKRI
jgi:hypothetical protein